jgi:drug/metabolite transporter (DMT)-like permease
LATGAARLADVKAIKAPIWLAIASTGVLDATANIMFVYGSGMGGLTLVSVLTSLYPLGTILLARLVLKEHLAISQSVGIALALFASVLLAI